MTAFQPDAFQEDAFQILGGDAGVTPPAAGGKSGVVRLAATNAQKAWSSDGVLALFANIQTLMGALEKPNETKEEEKKLEPVAQNLDFIPANPPAPQPKPPAPRMDFIPAESAALIAELQHLEARLARVAERRLADATIGKEARKAVEAALVKAREREYQAAEDEEDDLLLLEI